MEDPMLIVTRLAYKVRDGHEQLDEYLDEALGEYALALYAHLKGVREAVCSMKSAAHVPTNYRSTGLASLTENLENASQSLLALDREFMRYAPTTAVVKQPQDI
jgi:hypothetical protein